MSYCRRSAFLRLFVLPFTLTLWLAACASYKTLSQPYAESIATENPDVVRITLLDETQIDVAKPRCVGDTLVGFDNESWDRERRVYAHGIGGALADVSSIEEKSDDNTVMTLIPITLMLALVMNAADFSTLD